ncbi:hypothetical protein GOP47_0001426, partial [Adiantum capillus-veneris]
MSKLQLKDSSHSKGFVQNVVAKMGLVVQDEPCLTAVPTKNRASTEAGNVERETEGDIERETEGKTNAREEGRLEEGNQGPKFLKAKQGVSLSHRVCTRLDEEEILYETSGSKVRSRLVCPGDVGCIPQWIEEGDFVLARQTQDLNSTAFVRSVDMDNERALVAWEDEEHGQEWVDWKHIYKVMQ